MVQWLRLCVSGARGTGSITGQGTKIPHTVWHEKTFCLILELSVFLLHILITIFKISPDGLSSEKDHREQCMMCRPCVKYITEYFLYPCLDCLWKSMHETDNQPRRGIRKLGIFIFSEKAMAPHSSTLAWKIPWTEEPGRLQSMGSQSRIRLKRLSSSSNYCFIGENVNFSEKNHCIFDD